MKLTKSKLKEIIKEEIDKVLAEKTNYSQDQDIDRLLDKFDRADTKEDKAFFLKKIENIARYPNDVSNSAVKARYSQAKNVMARMADSEAPKDNVDRYFDRYKGTGNLPY